MKFAEYLDLHYQLFRVIVLQLGLNCPLRCRHCSVFAAPGRPEAIATTVATALVAEFSRLSTAKVVVLTGGEPFSDLPKLRAVLAEIQGHPNLDGYVITSANWASSLDEARDVIASLPPISLMMVSADEYHEEFVPRSNLQHALMAARAAGIDAVLSIAHHGPHDGYVAGLRDYLGEELWNDIEIEVVRVMPTGRAKVHGIGGFDTDAVALPEGACDIVGSPVVVASGTIIACCQIDAANEALRHGDSPYVLGQAGVDSFAQIQDRFEDDVVMQALRVWGPAELVRLLRAHGVEPALSSSYHGICFLCRDVLSEPTQVKTLRRLLSNDTTRRNLWMSRMLQYGEVRPCPVGAKS